MKLVDNICMWSIAEVTLSDINKFKCWLMSITDSMRSCTELIEVYIIINLTSNNHRKKRPTLNDRKLDGKHLLSIHAPPAPTLSKNVIELN